MTTFLQIKELVKKHGLQTVLDGATLSVAAGMKIGVIGRNGAGKSTLIRIILGQEEADSGEVILHPQARLGHLEQQAKLDLDEIAEAYLVRVSGKPQWACAKMASRFRVKPALLKRPLGELSEGFRMRVRLTAMLLVDPEFLLLDEPTNFLDVPTQILLERFLASWKGGFMLVSHDREFLKRTCELTLEVERGRLFMYPGDIEEYLAYKQSEVARIDRENVKIETKKRQLQTFVDRFRAKASKATQAQSKLKYLQKLETIEVATALKTVAIRINHGKIKKGIAVSCDEATIGYPGHVVAKDVTLDIRRGRHTAVVGENGQGKTTFLRTIAGVLPPLAGTAKWGSDLEIANYGQDAIMALSSTDTVGAYLYRSAAKGTLLEEIAAMAGSFLFSQDDREKKVEVLSGGEKARLVLAGLLLSKKPAFILDEPTNHLDFETVEALADALRAYPGTVVFVSHNRTFSHLLATEVVEAKDGTVRHYPDSYDVYVQSLDAAAMEEERVMQADEPVVDAEVAARKQEKRELREELDEQKKKFRRVERDLAAAEEERTNILAQMSQNPTIVSPSLGKKFKETNERIRLLEDDWLTVRMAIQWLERE